MAADEGPRPESKGEPEAEGGQAFERFAQATQALFAVPKDAIAAAMRKPKDSGRRNKRDPQRP
jgi:hypothetical protein